jgi:hypothetical protein
MFTHNYAATRKQQRSNVPSCWKWLMGNNNSTSESTKEEKQSADLGSAIDVEIIDDAPASDLENSAIYEAVRCPDGRKIITLLRSANGLEMTKLRMRNNGRQFLHVWAKSTIGDADSLLDVYLAIGGDINTKDYAGHTPLSLACLVGNIEKATALLEKGADVNMTNTCGETPLHMACFNNNSSLINLLLKHKANAECLDANGATLIHFCCSVGHSEQIPILMKNGVNVNHCDKWFRTPLMIAARNQKKDCVKLLLDTGCGVDDCDTYGCNAARCALLCAHYKPVLSEDDILMQLVRKGVDIYATADVSYLLRVLDVIISVLCRMGSALLQSLIKVVTPIL